MLSKNEKRHNDSAKLLGREDNQRFYDLELPPPGMGLQNISSQINRVNFTQGRRLSLRISLFFIIICEIINANSYHVAAQYLTSPKSGCYPCTNFLKREWRTDQLTCKGKKSDCGKCLEGYSADNMGEECILKGNTDVAIIYGYSNATMVYASFEETIIVQCYLGQEADCAWSRRGTDLEIVGRYRYTNAQNGIRTKDCSIKISRFREIDIGLWECHSLAEPLAIPMFSTSVHLLKVDVKYPSIEDGPKNASALIDNKINLICIFDDEVPCIWQHNGTEVDIQGRLYYTSSTPSHTKKDCSIAIYFLDEKDAGKWTCTYKASPRSIFTSSTARLTIVKMHAPTFPEISIRNSVGRHERSISEVSDSTVIVCSSRSGYPAPQLRWKMENASLELNEKVSSDGMYFDVEISMTYSQYKHLFKGVNILKCIAIHPLLNDTKHEASMLISIEAELPKETVTWIIIIIVLGTVLLVPIIVISILLLQKIKRINVQLLEKQALLNAIHSMKTTENSPLISSNRVVKQQPNYPTFCEITRSSGSPQGNDGLDSLIEI